VSKFKDIIKFECELGRQQLYFTNPSLNSIPGNGICGISKPLRFSAIEITGILLSSYRCFRYLKVLLILITTSKDGAG
jgi:hypothetical protein